MSERDDWVDEDPGDPALHAELASLLRAAAPPAPAVVERRALGRIRVERDMLTVASTLGGALLRVLGALPDYLAAERRRH
ncbi:MAG TPA: hypothetical protein VNU01_12395 [Egibacteraceae bacterium]|nr:hypothetical protein [Egibacteraceae bacterium]